MFQTKVVERIITHNLSQINLFNLKSCSLRENVEKNGTARVLTDDNTAQTQLMLNTQGPRHTFQIFNPYCFSRETVVRRSSSILRSTYIVSSVKRSTFRRIILEMILHQGESVYAALIMLRIWSCRCSFLRGKPTLRLHNTLPTPSLPNRPAASQKGK